MTAKQRDKCRHCHGRGVNRPRGLCWRCYHLPGVKDRYPALMNGTGRARAYGLGLVAPVKQAAQACAARPGTEGKMVVMRQRLERGEHLHHPEDGEL